MFWGYLLNVICATILFYFNKTGEIFIHMSIYVLLLSLINLLLSGLLKIFLRKIEFESIFEFCSICVMIIVIPLGSTLLAKESDLPQDFWFNDYFDSKINSPNVSNNEKSWLYLKRDFWWLIGPLYLMALFFFIKFLYKFLFSLKKIRSIFLYKNTRLSLFSLKEFFLTMNLNILQVKNVHKRVIQFISILLVFVIFKRNYFRLPILIYAHIFIFCVLWILYYCFEKFGRSILDFLIKYERQILFIIIINFVHSLYNYFYESTRFVELYIFAIFPLIIYIIIFLFNQKTNLNSSLLSFVKKLDPRVNFYIQQNIYLSYLIGFNLFYGSLKHHYTLYSILLIWIVLFLYIKLLFKNNGQINQNVSLYFDQIYLDQSKKSIVKILSIIAIMSFILIYFNL
jgi:hypothetical protein